MIFLLPLFYIILLRSDSFYCEYLHLASGNYVFIQVNTTFKHVFETARCEHSFTASIYLLVTVCVKSQIIQLSIQAQSKYIELRYSSCFTKIQWFYKRQ